MTAAITLAGQPDIPAWCALFLGLYALAVGGGEWRMPGGWGTALNELTESPGLRLVTGLAGMAAGAALYLACYWRSDDMLATMIGAAGGLALGMSLLLIAAPDRLLVLSRRLVDRTGSGLAALAIGAGFALILVAFARL